MLLSSVQALYIACFLLSLSRSDGLILINSGHLFCERVITRAHDCSGTGSNLKVCLLFYSRCSSRGLWSRRYCICACITNYVSHATVSLWRAACVITWPQIGVVTGYGFVATVVILVMPIATEFYELRKFMHERQSVEPCIEDLPQATPPPTLGEHAADADADGAGDDAKQWRRSARQVFTEITIDDGHASQTDMLWLRNCEPRYALAANEGGWLKFGRQTAGKYHPKLITWLQYQLNQTSRRCTSGAAGPLAAGGDGQICHPFVLQGGPKK